MREVTPKELREYNEKSWKETQKKFRRRLREIAVGGKSHTEYCEKEYHFGERIKPWLEGLGFVVKPDRRLNWWEISWPEQEDALERFRSESFKILTNPMPAKVTWGVRIEGQEGTWQKDMEQHDYVCSECDKHAEYVSDYCPNCGKKMATLLDGNRY